MPELAGFVLKLVTCNLSPFYSLVADIQAAQNAMQLVNGYNLQGKPLVIEFGKSKGYSSEADSAIPSSCTGENAPAK